MGGPGRPENLNPVKPGEVRNPTGINQYTYRADAERHLDRWCKKHGRELIERLLDDARSGKGYAMKLALDRILPAVMRHEVELPAIESNALEAALDRFAAERNPTPVPSKPNGNGAA